MKIDKKWLIYGGIAVGVILILLIPFTLIKASVHNAGIDKETAISHQNNDNTIVLNTMVNGVYDQVKIANLKSAQMDKIIKDAVAGQTSMTGQGAGSLFYAVHQAYPDLDLSIYDKIAVYVQGKRDEYQNVQQKLQDQLRDFDNWRLSWPNSMFAGSFPDENLYCTDDAGHRLTGKAALDYLNTISQPYGSNNGGGQGPINIPTTP